MIKRLNRMDIQTLVPVPADEKTIMPKHKANFLKIFSLVF